MSDDPLAPRRVPADAGAQLASWEAELARLRGTSSATAWDTAASEWDRLTRPHRAAYARLRQAEALLAKPDGRAAATPLLRTAAGQAVQHVPLLQVIHGLAQRARIDLTDHAEGSRVQTPIAAPTPFGLTERELAVLRLLGEGLTNTQIGSALFISPKTASVHVTHILRKLGVTTRAHAATVAARQGLLR
jgi:DNA-binding CsgD family transcriptional regulator